MNFDILLFQVFITDSKLLKKVFRLCCKKTQPKNYYKVIEHSLNATPDWPPVGEITYSSGTAADTTVS